MDFREKAIIERFEEKYIPVTESGCWIWTACTAGDGYGQFTINKKHYYAHRISFELFVATIPKGMCVLHKCDVPSCVNPSHLFLGSNLDNSRDMVKKGRSTAGESHAQSVLTAEDVIAIRASNETQASLAREYGVVQPTIHKIKARKIWGSI